MVTQLFSSRFTLFPPPLSCTLALHLELCNSLAAQGSELYRQVRVHVVRAGAAGKSPMLGFRSVVAVAKSALCLDKVSLQWFLCHSSILSYISLFKIVSTVEEMWGIQGHL